MEDMVYVTIGILINTAEGTTRRVDRGPSASDEDECKKFSEFWGSKCRLRRFRDGTIVEAVVWGEEDPGAVQQADNLINEIVQYSVARHMNFHLQGDGESSQVLSVSNQMNFFLPLSGKSASDDSSGEITEPSSLTQALTRSSDAGTLFRKAVESLDTLRKMMTSKITDFPLIFESFSGAHSSLRYTSFIPPVQHPIVAGTKQALNELSNKKMTRVIEPFNVIGTLSNSSRWPTELEALRTAKTALIIRLSKCIKQQFELKSMIHRDFLDIFFQGYVFRLQLYTDQELLLLTNPRAHLMMMPSKAPVQQTFQKYDNIEACQLHRRMVVDPLHHAAVRGLSSRFSAFGDTVRLMLCWRDNHMLSNHFNLEMIELIVASVFTEKLHLANNDELPCTNVPQSPTVAFLRTLIRLSNFNWTDSILLVDFLTYRDEDADILEKTKTFIQDMNSQYKAVKSAGHEPAMTVGAQYDEYNGFAVAYGLTTPDKSIVSVIAGMAKSSADQLINWMSSPRSTSTAEVMVPAQNIIASCNVILQFRGSVVCGKNKIGVDNLSGNKVMNSYLKGPSSSRIEIFSNISSEEKSGACLIGRNTPLPHPLQVEILSTLTEEFGHVAIFFVNYLRGDQIGIRWKPNAFLPVKFSMLQCRHHYISTTPGNSGGLMVLNAAAVVAEMVNRSSGLVEDVTFL
jgi:U3 small nucleolar RNA-associated protein 22